MSSLTKSEELEILSFAACESGWWVTLEEFKPQSEFRVIGWATCRRRTVKRLDSGEFYEMKDLEDESDPFPLILPVIVNLDPTPEVIEYPDNIYFRANVVK